MFTNIPSVRKERVKDKLKERTIARIERIEWENECEKSNSFKLSLSLSLSLVCKREWKISRRENQVKGKVNKVSNLNGKKIHSQDISLYFLYRSKKMKEL